MTEDKLNILDRFQQSFDTFVEFKSQYSNYDYLPSYWKTMNILQFLEYAKYLQLFSDIEFILPLRQVPLWF